MPDALIVSICLFVAGASFAFSPMPVMVRILLGLSFVFLGITYAVTTADILTMAERAFLLRYGMIVLSSVVTICIAAWRIAGGKIWRRQ